MPSRDAKLRHGIFCAELAVSAHITEMPMTNDSKHIFLVAAPRSGKSTVIDAVLASLGGARVGGFRSYFGADRECASRSLYMCAAGEKPVFDEAHTIARFYEYGTFSAFPARFDAAAERCLASSQQRDIIVMDECSFLEKDALLWQRAVLNALDGDTPILGVVRLFERCWTQKIAAHPNVRLVELTTDNRDALVAELAEYFQALVKRRA